VERRPPTWAAHRTLASFLPTGDSQLDSYLQQLEAEPDNQPLQLAVARASGKSGRLDLATLQYKALIRTGANLDTIVEDIQDLIRDNGEQQELQRLYRLLGDAYSKQNRYRDAVEAYSWTFGG
jgi:tetratricopeptide (TPR) repeat protein